MKNTFLLSLALLSFGSFAGTSIVTDLDDTVKITNAGDIVEAGVNGVFTTSIYTGMDHFLNESKAEGDSDETHVVTASPTVLKSRVNSLLKKYQIDADSVSLRNVIKEKTPAFKKRIIRNILAKSDDDFILIGDDVNEDHLIYDDLQKEFPERIKAIYIHVIKNRELPSSAIQYWTAFDLTLREHLAGRLPFSAVSKVADAVMEQKKIQRIIPKFADCPTDRAVFAWHSSSEEATDLSAKVTGRVISHCLSQATKN